MNFKSNKLLKFTERDYCNNIDKPGKLVSVDRRLVLILNAYFENKNMSKTKNK